MESATGWERASTADAAVAGLHEQVVRDARMVWKKVPESWQTAPFLANARLGVQIYRDAAATGSVLKFMLSHSEVQDQRAQWEAGIGLSRLPIGYLTLTMAGGITGIDWELDLWNAELTGTVTTTQGSIQFSALVLKEQGALLVSMVPSTGEASAAWAFQPLPSKTTRQIRVPEDYVGNPPANIGTSGDTRYAEQTLLAGGGYTTAWQEKREGTRRLLAATVVYGYPDSTGLGEATAAVRQVLATPPDGLVAGHRGWWNGFYARSFVSVPDKWVQRFYWIQLYKMASATRADAPVLSEWGPWFPEVGNSWTAVWWNLNVQVSYPLVQSSNHPELDAVTAAFRRFERNLPLSVPEAYRDGETYALSHPGDWTLRPGGTRTVGIPGTSKKTDQTGNLIWGLHNVWLAYRHSMDKTVLRDVLYPILGKALNFYARFLAEGNDGALHLPLTRSPEYADAEDCTYDLSLVRWACATLVESARTLGIDDPRLPRWRDILARLVPYQRDERGTLIGRGVPLAQSHRHFSHLLWLYPLEELRWERPEDRALMKASFDHWASMRDLWHGFSFAAASSMASRMAAPEEALSHLRFFLDGNIVDKCQLTPNTMYREGSNFAIESPLAAAQSVLDMLVQSGRVVDVFPSVSTTWADASFAQLRTQGAFLVDASRRKGRTEWIRIRSEAGSPLLLRHRIAGTIDVRDAQGRPLPWRQAEPDAIAIDLRCGDTALITPRGQTPNTSPRDVTANGDAKRWGLP
ncbi:glycosyl hydrolase family 95 catalytic domain-containing protein [Pendulispora albinea]|uniref:Glycosyl hydrolase family 95 catalytic domain-containing protein n=1 Tax=Pendulispora albinea TaxID=2741071 RepID=A0ABZ2M7P1_9BACT